ncbi:MAG TPA: hypothetical protein PKI61_02910 [bacterium]|nr:hypothetical protein [bacterium]HPT29767.1 hypothetical protein [bacterium]
MDIQDLMKNIKNLTEYQIEERLEHLIHSNYHFSNLSSDNKEIVLNLLKEYKAIIRNGREITATKIREDMYDLHQKRLSLNLSQTDLDQIKKILEAFRA